ncbi:MAG: hypothetical protein ACLQVN_08635, partial [Bryobacteraceae bacterium]
MEKAFPTVKMVPGENHRERVLTPEEELLYFRAASSKAMEQHRDPRLVADVGRILLGCALRPEECFRLRRENVVDGKLEIHFGKSENARRRIPMTPNVQAILEMRLSNPAGAVWVFPANPTFAVRLLFAPRPNYIWFVCNNDPGENAEKGLSEDLPSFL